VSSPRRSVEAVLLDIDGTLLDSNDAHAQAWSDTLTEAGIEIGSEVCAARRHGVRQAVAEAHRHRGGQRAGKQLIERRKEIFAKEYLPSVRPFPQATDLLARMRDDGLRLVVATSASEDELRGCCAR
jgi:beta-phosphoglucomutase-like phosphatase (HAD superfamily)